MEKITYLVTNYNNGKYLNQLLDSLWHQSSSDWLCLLGDDASTDDSINIVKNHPSFEHICSKLRIISNHTNRGKIETLRRLIDEASTDIVGILDADDAIESEATSVVLGYYKKNPQCQFAYSRLALMNATLDQKIETWGERVPTGSTSLQKGALYHLRTFRRVAYFNTDGLDDTMLYAEDTDLDYKLEEITHAHFLPHTLYKYRRHADSASNERTTSKICGLNGVRAKQKALRRRNPSPTIRSMYMGCILKIDRSIETDALNSVEKPKFWHSLRYGIKYVAAYLLKKIGLLFNAKKAWSAEQIRSKHKQNAG